MSCGLDLITNSEVPAVGRSGQNRVFKYATSLKHELDRA